MHKDHLKAAILLKLGGFGLLKIKFYISNFNIWLTLIFSIGLYRIVWISFLRIQLVDIKSLIAFSSVAHIGIGLVVFMSKTFLGEFCFLLILVRHGFSSSLIFFQRNLLYQKIHSRRLLISKGISNWGGLILIYWRIRGLGIIGAPPLFNLWVEIRRFIAIQSIYSISIKFLFWRAFFTGAYCLVVIRIPYQSQHFSLRNSKIYTNRFNLIHLFSFTYFLIFFTFCISSMVI